MEFKNGKDQDYLSGDYNILVTSKEDADNYVVSGYTHGGMSHSLKHLIEYDPNFVQKEMNNLKNDIKGFMKLNPDHFLKIYNKTTGFLKLSPEQVLEKLTEPILINALDIINDDIINNTFDANDKLKKLMKPHAMKMKKRYEDIVNNKIDTAVDLDSVPEKSLLQTIRNSTRVKFQAVAKMKTDKNAYFLVMDFSDLSITICSDKIKTSFILQAATSPKSFIDIMLNKNYNVKNRKIDQALRKAF